ncbi:SIMPL domain-containing protein [Leucobacter celer]|uniref:SIMPL domain-containing protein n=1 Tax=Leucobacter celer TaxID=668625 RepID=UPI0006A77F08|nr:SIMPL domain-containing protein [Leucobacter celer]
MTTIHATGTSEEHFPAERATITARVTATSRDRSASIADATRVHNWTVQRAEQLRANGDATWHAADPVSTWAHKTYAQGSQQQVVIEHTTSSRVRIKLSNLALVSELVTEFAEAGLTTDVDWTLTEASRRAHERRARAAAVGEARMIAEDYATALGRRIGTVVSVSDAPSTPFPAQARFAAAGAFGDAPAEVTIAEITVSATVSGVYETD